MQCADDKLMQFIFMHLYEANNLIFSICGFNIVNNLRDKFNKLYHVFRNRSVFAFHKDFLSPPGKGVRFKENFKRRKKK